MLPTKVPADIHELHGIERTPAFPRRTGCVRALPVKTVLSRNQAGTAGTVFGAEIARNVRTQHHVEIMKEAGIHHVGAAGEQFFGDSGVNADGALNIVLLHQALDRYGRSDVNSLTGIMSFAVARTAGNERSMIRHTGFLGGLGQTVDVGHEADDRFPRAPTRDKRSGHAGHASRNAKTLSFEA